MLKAPPLFVFRQEIYLPNCKYKIYYKFTRKKSVGKFAGLVLDFWIGHNFYKVSYTFCDRVLNYHENVKKKSYKNIQAHRQRTTVVEFLSEKVFDLCKI